MVLHNTGSAPVAFKVKTTAPDQYSVRPNAGKVEPNSQLTLQAYLHPVQTDIKDRSRDRFLIQAVELTSSEQEASDLTQMWQRIEAEEKQRMMMFRLKCVITPSENQSATGISAEKENLSSRMNGTEATPPASPKTSSHDNTHNALSPSSPPPSLSQDSILSAREERARQLANDATQNKTKITQLEKELAQTKALLEQSERRCEQYKASLVDKYGAHHAQLLIQQQEHEHPILVVWVAAALTFIALRLVI
ncbi:PapD-like protein [Dichotomocladium elegans]|nr:PapD-like protein [Dichotomocladium elegans]